MVERAELTEEENVLVKAALEAMKNAYIVCGFKVGAAVLAEDNKIYQGCNIENQISGLGICAERCAINHAVLHGNTHVKKVAVVIGDENVKETRPCGMCLQYIYDFSQGQAKVIMAKSKNGRIVSESIQVKSIVEMLPFPFQNVKKATFKKVG